MPRLEVEGKEEERLVKFWKEGGKLSGKEDAWTLEPSFQRVRKKLVNFESCLIKESLRAASGASFQSLFFRKGSLVLNCSVSFSLWASNSWISSGELTR